MSCLFCKIVAGEIPSTAVYQDELAYAFADINPKAPVHVLIVPREHIASLDEAGKDHRALLGHLMWAAAEIARQKGLGEGLPRRREYRRRRRPDRGPSPPAPAGRAAA